MPMSEVFEIKRAARTQARLRLAMCAASNGGKTWSSLELAFGIVTELLDRKVLAGGLEGKVGMIDTERRSGQLYAHLGPFDTIELSPPYTVDRYVGALQALERSGVAVIIIDQISHAWAGPGGILALLDRIEDSKRFSAFGKVVNPAQDEFVDAMLRSPCHIIASMRSKTEWVLEDKPTRDGRTVKAPRRIGMAPIQRPGIEYEFTTMFDLDTDTHQARVLKNRCPVFDEWVPKKLTREHGRALAAWLLEGAPEPAGVVTGTPLERAQAVRDAAVRRFSAALTVPDLATVFDEAQRALRAFPPAVPVDEIRAMLEVVVAAKDARKVALGGALGESVGNRPAVELLDPRSVADLELMFQELGLNEANLMKAFQVNRLRMLPADRLQALVDWMANCAMSGGHQLALTPHLVAMGATCVPEGEPAGAFDTLEDDLPWKD